MYISLQGINTLEKTILHLQTETFYLNKWTNQKTSGQMDIKYENVRKA